MSSIARRQPSAAWAGEWHHLRRLEPVRLLMLAALPAAVFAGSPQRVAVSAAVTALYVGVAAVTARMIGVN